MRFGLGPVFTLEWTIAARRWQMYALRSLFGLSLLIAMMISFESASGLEAKSGDVNAYVQGARMAQFAENFFNVYVIIQLTLVLLVAPAATAGAISLDKARGSLMHVLVTDLSNSEIILGKLVGRLMPIFGLVLCGVPVLSVAALLGGIDFEALFLAFAVSLATAVLVSALALTLSVWGRKPHEVLIATYAIIMVWLFHAPMCEWFFQDVLKIGGASPELWHTNPYSLALSAYSNPFGISRRPFEPKTALIDWFDVTAFVIVCIVLALLFIVVAIVSVRRVALRQAGNVEGPRRVRQRKRFLDTTLLDNDPAYWLERHRRRSTRWSRFIWRAYIGLFVFFAALAGSLSLLSWDKEFLHMAMFCSTYGPIFGLLMVSVRSVTVFADERNRGNLHLLLTTTVTSRSIVFAKWWSSIRELFVPALLTTLLALAIGYNRDHLFFGFLAGLPVLTTGALLTSLGLYLGIRIARQTMAMAVNLILIILVSVGWPRLVDFDLLRFGGIVEYFLLIQASPLVTLFTPIRWAVIGANIGPHYNDDVRFFEFVGWCLWITVQACGAAILLRMANRCFDRRMGRAEAHPSQTQAPIEMASLLNLPKYPTRQSR